MSSPTAVTLFSGGDLSATGIRQAGYTLVGAVEWDAAIAECYARNLSDHCAVADVGAVDYRPWAGIDLLQASPACTNASQAKAGGTEQPADHAAADAICRALREMRPGAFVLENVGGYATFGAYHAICRQLLALGYTYQAGVVNAASWGVPQTRKRLILRAVAPGRTLPAWSVTHAEGATGAPNLFGPGLLPWVGWYAALADLLDTLPPSAFAPWQLARLPAELTDNALLGNQQSDDKQGTPTGYGVSVRRTPEPALTVRVGVANIPRAFLIGSGNTQLTQVDSKARWAEQPMFTVSGPAAVRTRAFLLSGHSDLARREAHEPAITLTATDDSHTIHRAFLMHDGNPSANGPGYMWDTYPAPTVRASQERAPLRAWLDQGRVVQLTPRALARLQTVPDAYTLPEKRDLACRVIGNGVPCLLMRRIAESLRGAA